MTIILEHVTLPERGVFELDVKQSIEIKISAEEARRKVNRWLLEYVSYMMHADPPTFVVDGAHAVWRVPAIFTASRIGDVGVAGTVDIHAQTGEIEEAEQKKKQITNCALEMAKNLPPYQPRTSVPDEYIPIHIPAAELIDIRNINDKE